MIDSNKREDKATGSLFDMIRPVFYPRISNTPRKGTLRYYLDELDTLTLHNYLPLSIDYIYYSAYDNYETGIRLSWSLEEPPTAVQSLRPI